MKRRRLVAWGCIWALVVGGCRGAEKEAVPTVSEAATATADRRPAPAPPEAPVQAASKLEEAAHEKTKAGGLDGVEGKLDDGILAVTGEAEPAPGLEQMRVEGRFVPDAKPVDAPSPATAAADPAAVPAKGANVDGDTFVDEEAVPKASDDDSNINYLADKTDAERSRQQGGVTVVVDGRDALREVPPERVLPRQFYFENTYLGGSAAHAERMRQLDLALRADARPYRLVAGEAQPFDPPRTDGLALYASVDATHIESARRVFLQIGLRGSERHGWRRPPIDAVLVIDDSALAGGRDGVVAFIAEVLRQLGPTDRLGVVATGSECAVDILGLARIDAARQQLAHRVESLAAGGAANGSALVTAMARAGAMLRDAGESPHAVPGTQMVLVLAGDAEVGAVRQAAGEAHALTLQGAVTSVFSLGTVERPWWQVADAGYGNWHRVAELGAAGAVAAELEALSRVVARLVRINVRLGRHASAIRVLGTRVLEAGEVERVKARELAADRSLSKTLGIASDRGDDDDGIQTVIPYFLGDDSHVILMELWVEEPGVVADVSVRYKDMVNLDNAAARTSVQLGARPRNETPEQGVIARNVAGFMLAEELQRASLDVLNNNRPAAAARLGRARAMAGQTNPEDQQAIEAIQSMAEEGAYDAKIMSENMLLSGQRRIGTTRK
jgi:hypothetical protein